MTKNQRPFKLVKWVGKSKITRSSFLPLREVVVAIPETIVQVHLYTICWNEADIFGFFFRHYDPIVTRYFIYDDGSDDGSIEVLKAHPKVELRRFSRQVGDSFVLSHQLLQNEVWKDSRGKADWIIMTAIDEHLTPANRDLGALLKNYRRYGITLAPAIGYQMISETFPSPNEWLCRSRTVGAPSRYMNKLSIFNPDAILETGFALGRHNAEPSGDLRYPSRDEIMLLHYKNMDFERTLARQMELAKRLGKTDNESSLGFHYHRSREELRSSWDEVISRSADMSSAHFKCWEAFAPPLWWRQDTHPSTGSPPTPQKANAGFFGRIGTALGSLGKINQ
jgi:Glycosyl transferase family 2